MKINIDPEDGFVGEPCISCTHLYFDDLYFEPTCDEKECLFPVQYKNRTSIGCAEVTRKI